MTDAPFPPQFYDEWVAFFENCKEPNHLTCYSDLFKTDLFPLQRKEELGAVIRLINRNSDYNHCVPRALMEIGADKCGTLFHWLKAFPSINCAVVCEVRGTPYADLFEKNFPHVKFLWLSESSRSRECLNKVEKFLDDQKLFLDFLFIDGDKSYFGEDFDRYSPLIAQHGIALFHDVFDDDQPMQADFLARASKYTKTQVIIDTSECDQRKRLRLESAAKHESVENTPHTQWLDIWSHTSCGFGCIWPGSKK